MPQERLHSKVLYKLYHLLECTVEICGAYMMALMVALVFYQVFGRYILHRTPGWTEEVALLSMMAYGFLSIAIGFARGSHLSINILYDQLPLQLRRVLDRFYEVLVIGCGVFLLIEGYKFTVLTWSSILPATGLPNGLQYLIVPITGIVIIVFGLFKLIAGEKEDQS
ncbi:TRAP transporter small permease [Neomoorella thermoacetica]|uniref:TRAP transporter small permease n=1 Tax=Neomoorella thermoacetica TaxID=1525 RepID=UPI0008FB4230|nr:TRAP transporter small permease [Moorella thermoacetica]APC07506.1 2,3-diketo-L-gulonate TRAP transporter small permease protein YiaM [Moorella thermoacetica]